MNEITWNQICDLLSLAAVYDQRTVSDEDVRGWLLVAQSQGWTVATATRAIVEHYASGADRPRITPAAITDALRAARRGAASTFAAPDPPDDLPAREYPAWLRARRDEHVEAVLAAWADGAPMPVTVQDAAELPGARLRALPAGWGNGCPPEVREEVQARLARVGREPRRRPVVRLRRGFAGDPVRRAEARAELAGREPAPIPGDDTDGGAA